MPVCLDRSKKSIMDIYGSSKKHVLIYLFFLYSEGDTPFIFWKIRLKYSGFS